MSRAGQPPRGRERESREPPGGTNQAGKNKQLLVEKLVCVYVCAGQSEDPIYLFFFLNIFIDYAITVVPFSPFYSRSPCTPPPTHIPPLQFTSMGHTYKFFGFSISYTILTLPLSIFYLPFMLLIPCTFSPSISLLLPADNPPCDLHFCDSVPVLVFCLVFFCCCCCLLFFQVWLLIVVSFLPFYCSCFGCLFLR